MNLNGGLRKNLSCQILWCFHEISKVISTAENSVASFEAVGIVQTDENPPRKPQTSIGSSCPTKVRIDNPEDSMSTSHSSAFWCSDFCTSTDTCTKRKLMVQRSLDEPVNNGMKEHISKKGVYTVKEGYQQLCSRNPVIANWPWKLIWRIKLPPK
ncbi:hypothetical protein H5410_042438, partial [Solanum commersonii]